MRKLLFFLLALCLCASAAAQQILPQIFQTQPSGGGSNTWTTSTGWSTTGTTSSSLTCSPACTAMTVPTTVVGDLVTIELFNVAGGVSISSVSGGGTWVVPGGTSCNASQAGAGHVHCAFMLGAASAVTSITITMTGSQGGNFFNIRSYHPSSTTAVAETVPAGTTSSSCSNNCNAPSVTLTGTSDVIVSTIATGDSGCSAASPFGNFTAPDGDGMADNLNTSSGTGAVFTQGNSCPTAAASSAAMNTVAFK
jgi:hypothetical protein